MKPDTLALVTIVKNETPYILEWIAHYHSIGIGDIIIYDNETVDPDETLQKLDRAGVCKVIPWRVEEGTSPQIAAYNDALSRFRARFEFIGFFDADEFLRAPSGLDIAAWLRRLPEDVGAIAINQCIFGSSGRLARGSGLVTERFVRCSVSSYDENYWVKSIYRTDAVERITTPHHGVLKGGSYILPNGSLAFTEEAPAEGKAVTIDHGTLILNHYITKSLEEFLQKRARGGGAGPTEHYRKARHASMVFFDGREVKGNETSDFTLAKQSDHLRNIMKRLAEKAELPGHLMPPKLVENQLPERMISAGTQVLEAYLGEKIEGVDTRRLLIALFEIMDSAGRAKLP